MGTPLRGLTSNQMGTLPPRVSLSQNYATIDTRGSQGEGEAWRRHGGGIARSAVGYVSGGVVRGGISSGKAPPLPPRGGGRGRCAPASCPGGPVVAGRVV